jgi:Co/Zn/Cd efflux system component
MSHAPMHAASDRKTLKLILLISAVAFSVQVFVGMMYGSLAVMGDGFHTFIDNIGYIVRFAVLSLPIVLLFLSRRAEKQKAGWSQKLLRSFQQIDLAKIILQSQRFSSLMLVGTGLFLFCSAAYRFFHPQAIEADVSVWAAVIGLVCNLLQMMVHMVIGETEGRKDVFFHLLGDSLHSFGAVFAVVFIWQNEGDRFYWASDVWITVCLGLMMLVWGTKLLEELTPAEVKRHFPDQRVIVIAGLTIALRKKHVHTYGCHRHTSDHPNLRNVTSETSSHHEV